MGRETAKEPKKRSLAEEASRQRPARAELVWEGKYDAAGRRAAPMRVALPFQTVETVNESAQDRQSNLQFGPGFREEEWRNRLIWGDKKYVLPSLLPEFAGRVNLIYIDPPFDTGAVFSFTATVPEHPDGEEDNSFTFTKEPSIIEHKAYRDTWGRGLESYFQWFYATVALLHEMLSENGTLYVHLDWHVAHYAKTILDEVFGPNNFINEIIWRRKQASAWLSNQFGVINDTLYLYVKGDNYVFNPEYSKDDENTKEHVKERFVYDDGEGRKYRKSPVVNPLYRKNLKYIFHGVNHRQLAGSIRRSEWNSSI
ncbi:MAG: DNA methyltransferase [Methylocella sp.]